MSDEPYYATPEELAAIDEGLAGPFIPEAELPAAYRAFAAELRRRADLAEAVEMRIMLLEGAERFERMARTWDQCPLLSR